MSQIYDLLEDLLVEYQETRTPDELQILVNAADKLEDAFDSESLAAVLKKLRQAATSVRELEDDNVTLLFDFYLGNELVGTAHQAQAGIEVLRPAAQLTRTEAFAESPLRLATNNILATALALVDPAGHADEIRLIHRLVDESPIADEEDRLLALSNRFEAEVATDDLVAATQTRDEMWVNARSLDDMDYFVHLATFDCDLAYIQQDWSGLREAVEQIWRLEKAVDEEDVNWMAALGAHALANAKSAQQAVDGKNELTKNPFPERPAGFPFYRYWCQYHLEVGNTQTAVSMAKQGYKEIRGLGQDYIEAQMLCVLIQTLAANGQHDDAQLRTNDAYSVAERLRDPQPLKKKICDAVKS